MEKLTLTRSIHKLRDGYKMVWYEQKGCKISVHRRTGGVLIDYGQELRTLTRQEAATLIRKMRRGEHVPYGRGYVGY